MPVLQQSLLDTERLRLDVIAKFWEIPLTSHRRREMALQLAEAMPSPEAVAAARAKLTNDQREALRTVAAGGGTLPQRVFARQWGDIRVMGPGRMDREHPWENPVSPAEALWYSGFLFKTFAEGSDGAYEAVAIPAEILDLLPAPAEDTAALSLDPASPPPIVNSAGAELLEDACTFLSYVHNHQPAYSSEGTWSARHNKQLLPRLLHQTRDRFHFLRHLASRIGWVTDQNARRASLVPDAVTEWLTSQPNEQRRLVYVSWRDDPTWNDLFHVPTLQPEDTGAWRNDPLLAREAILAHLATCTPTSWLEIERFVGEIKRVDPDFQRPTGDYETWYIKDDVTGAYLSGFESWDAVEGRLIRYLLTGPLFWLGLIDLGTEKPGQSPRAFRLSDAGAAILGLRDQPVPPEPPTIRLRSGFQLLVPIGRRYERFQVGRVAEWLDSGERYRYRLTPASLQRAKEQRITIPRVLTFLEDHLQGPVPRHMREALTQWDERGTEASLHQAVLLRTTNEAIMERALASGRVAHLVEERISPTAVVVRRGDWPEMIEALEQLGLLADAQDAAE